MVKPYNLSGNQSRARILMLAIFLFALQGCLAAIGPAMTLGTSALTGLTSYDSKTESGNKIKAENIDSLQEGKSTKTDVIALFGVPTPAFPPGVGAAVDSNGIPSAIITSGDDSLMIYKHCVTKLKMRSGLAASVRGGKDIQTDCEQLTVMLDKYEIVSAYSYHPRNPLTNENAKKLAKGQGKRDVIRLMGAPASIAETSGDEVYIYKKCEFTVEHGDGFGFSESSTDQKCARLAVVLGKKSGEVKSYRYQP